MIDVAYRIVEHDGGWAYKLGDVFSETFPNRETAADAANRVAAEQRVPGETEAISYQDETGAWHDEVERGDNRPHAFVSDAPPALTDVTGRGDPTPSSAPDTLRREVKAHPIRALVFAVVSGYLFARILR